MNTELFDIEAYARTGSLGAVVSLMSRSIGPLELSGVPEDEPLIFQSGNVSVVLQPCEDGFLSVWVRGSAAWSSCSALGRHLAKELSCVVRCDPGNEFPEVSPYANVFLEIDGCNESLVPWG